MIKVCYIIGQLIRGGTEKQLYENEDIVNKAYKILDGSDK